MIEVIFRWLLARGVEDLLAIQLARYGSILFVILLSISAFYVARRIIIRLLLSIIERSKTQWDDYLFKHSFFTRLAYLAPAAVLYLLAPYALEGFLFESWQEIVNITIVLYTILLATLIIDSLLSSALDIARQNDYFKELPFTSLIQTAKIIIYIFGTILFASVLLGQSPVYLLSGLGALAAVLSFVYQDALRGLVAGIQLTGNKMVSRGDWIEMPSYDVNGTVAEVGLTTIKINNFDHSITTVPTYALISSSFKNWQAMLNSDGRRAVRSFNIDATSIKFCSAEMLEHLRKIQLITKYIDERQAEIDVYNREMGVDESVLVNGRRQTNLGIFRAYLNRYLHQHPAVNTRMFLSVHQLEPTAEGVPIQLIFFTPEKTANYMAVQSDIFEHVLAVIPEFDLRLFQHPSGRDFHNFASNQHD